MAQAFSLIEHDVDEDGRVPITIEMDDDLHQGLVEAAKRAGLGLEAFIAQILEQEWARVAREHHAALQPSD